MTQRRFQDLAFLTPNKSKSINWTDYAAMMKLSSSVDIVNIMTAAQPYYNFV